ncbi:uncharacterized protein A1O9_00718 [Exophiala aquamarina CBS 119918]|uniref:Xylanolytic transcriptional activator regulatory domain-containing protein n=1 Tax=Exophiala aquamarina CBS 119918 TaxID=1182545 RepID=A0A072Q4B5_9EURO|nr:uncharacterized protein A1O9_00718 [Exophiala aquamarina CBS 119918]KEF62745.1 hypothetical protein A1O9_00718 [Exophiala aquamarina CBS 119918]
MSYHTDARETEDYPIEKPQTSLLALLADFSDQERAKGEEQSHRHNEPIRSFNESTQGHRPSTVSNLSPQSSAPTAHSPKDPKFKNSHPQQAATSGMIGSLPDQGPSHEYFGGSSAGSFVGQVRAAVSQKLNVRDQRLPTDEITDGSDPSSARLQSHSRLPIDFVLPSRRRADELMEVYWEFVYPLYPYVDKTETILKYQDLWKEKSDYDEEAIFICGLNVIFALSCQLIGETHQRENSAKVFFERAKSLLDPWHSGSFQYVQVCLLLGQYFQSTNDPHQCWTTVGMAIRTGQSLGLHLPETSENTASPRKRELLRKVWHGCVIMDRITSMTYGRPTMIGKDLAAAVPRPLGIDEDRLQPFGPVPTPDRPSIVDFFVETLGLYEILYDILVAFYSSSIADDGSGEGRWARYFGGSEPDTNKGPSVHAIDRRLIRWEANLPSHLKTEQVSTQTETNKYFVRQAVILRQRYLHIRLLALRPVLSAYVAAETSNDDITSTFGGILTQRIAFQCAIVCITVAQDTIDLAYTRRSGDPAAVGPIAAWWYNVLFVYSAATVLVAGKLCPSILTELSEKSISRSWHRAIEILEHYQAFGPVIKQLVAAQHVLFNTLPEHYSQTKGSRRPENSSGHLDLDANNLSALSSRYIAPMGPNPYSHLDSDIDVGGGCNPLASADLSNQAFNYDFDFVFDNNDLSWLNSMPFEL